jgi:hypothetical protein
MFKKLAGHPNGPGSGLMKNVVQTAEYAGASYLLGYVQNAYPGKAQIFGVPLDLATGVAMKAASLLSTFTGFATAARPHLDTVGNAGLGAYFHMLGSGAGFHKSGRVRAILPPGSVDKVMKAAPGTTLFGVAARAPQGDLLSASDLSRLASR